MGSRMCMQPSVISWLYVMDLMTTTWLVETCCLCDTFMVIKYFVVLTYLNLYLLPLNHITDTRTRYNWHCVDLFVKPRVFEVLFVLLKIQFFWGVIVSTSKAYYILFFFITTPHSVELRRVRKFKIIAL